MIQLRATLLFLTLAICGQAQTVLKTMKRLPDSGQTTSYTITYGEDADYSIHVPYFIKYNIGTTVDTVTGLMWQSVDGGEMTIENARNYVDTLTLGGFTDWRLPNAQESFSILNLDRLNPAMDVAAFPANNAEYWWTSEVLFNNSAKIWVTNSGGGIGPHPKTETISAGGTKRFQVRAVRDVVPPTSLTHFTDNVDGTITDNLTQLIWQKTSPADTLTWEQALLYAENLSLAGKTDWRLPNIKELNSINDESRNAPSANTDFFPGIQSGRYWSSTSQKNQAGNAWFNDFQNYGITSYFTKTKAYYVICVRGGTGNLSSVESPVEDTGLEVYPNPTNAFLYIHFKSDAERNFSISLYNTTGSLIQRARGNSKLDLRTLPKGIYVVRVTDGQRNWTQQVFLE